MRAEIRMEKLKISTKVWWRVKNPNLLNKLLIMIVSWFFKKIFNEILLIEASNESFIITPTFQGKQ